MSPRWTKEQDKMLMRCMADSDLAGAAQAVGRSEWACYGRYRVKGYHLSSKGSRRLSTKEKQIFAVEMRQIMLAHNISQRELASAYNCEPRYICQILRLQGDKSLTEETAENLRSALEMAIQYQRSAAE